MDMLSGSQINSFLSATSLLWASSFVLIMVGLVFYIKYQERHESIKHSKFFTLFLFTVILNVLEYVMNIVMQNNPSYEVIIYKVYIFVKFLWNISIMFYVISFVQSSKLSRFSVFSILKVFLIIISLLCCIFLDISSVLENNGKFYVLVGRLNEVFTFYALFSNSILLLIVLWFRKKLPKGFCVLSITIFFIYLGLFIFKNITGYMVKDSVFIYSILMLIIFNTTSNQDKEFVNNLNQKKNILTTINERRSKLIDQVTFYVGQTLNDVVLYNDEIYLNKYKDREFIQNSSKEIEDRIQSFNDYLNSVNDIYYIESNKNINNKLYTLSTLIEDIDSKVLEKADLKKILFNITIGDNSFINYIGDLKKIERVVINLLLCIVHYSNEKDTLDLIISSKQKDLNHIELVFTINSSSLKSVINSSMENDIFSKRELDAYDLKMVVSNELLQMMNSKLDSTKDASHIAYNFSVLQGFHSNELFNNIN